MMKLLLLPVRLPYVTDLGLHRKLLCGFLHARDANQADRHLFNYPPIFSIPLPWKTSPVYLYLWPLIRKSTCFRSTNCSIWSARKMSRYRHKTSSRVSSLSWFPPIILRIYSELWAPFMDRCFSKTKVGQIGKLIFEFWLIYDQNIGGMTVYFS